MNILILHPYQESKKTAKIFDTKTLNIQITMGVEILAANNKFRVDWFIPVTVKHNPVTMQWKDHNNFLVHHMNCLFFEYKHRTGHQHSFYKTFLKLAEKIEDQITKKPEIPEFINEKTCSYHQKVLIRRDKTYNDVFGDML